ncbi:GGDEF domain-containing protein [Amycolatopsis aidingensis]|uniref:GGDEF domain-containing protein n=1 Tax=Amycolatopsis aidingensis TaxID=2842453 RepID=UPI001E495159|nr:GGDEF domain-containing protein [Amycolatopsis aidingensis]
MEVPATGAASGGDGEHAGAGRIALNRARRDSSLRALRARWRTASLAAGWHTPSDWALPEVETVCAAVLAGGAPEDALAALGRARAKAGTGLAETLVDLAALHAVLEHPDSGDGFVAPDVDATPARLLRVTAVAWADVVFEQLTAAEVTDALTGLPTAAYLRTRMAELYRQAAKDGGTPAEGFVLLVVHMDFGEAAGWSRLTGMILAADALRLCFDGGESLAAIGPSTVAALVPREEGVAARAVSLRRELTERLAIDRQLREVGRPRISAVRLPATHEAACDLLARL